MRQRSPLAESQSHFDRLQLSRSQLRDQISSRGAGDLELLGRKNPALGGVVEDGIARRRVLDLPFSRDGLFKTGALVGGELLPGGHL